MKAVILCGGLGTRLRPLTDTIPKVMVPIGGKPLIQRHIEWLVGNGIQDIGINLFYLPQVVKDHVKDGSQWGARIHYSHQDTLSGTAGDFRAFKDFVGDQQCLVIYGDNLFSLDLNHFKEFHEAKKGTATIALREWEDPTSKGIVGLDNEQKILWFKEKPKPEEVTSTIGNAAIYILEPELFSHIPDTGEVDFGMHTFPSLLEKNKHIYGYVLSTYHKDIGTHEALQEAREDIQKIYPHKAVFLDRDGVLNKKPAVYDYVKSFEEFEWNPGAKELVKQIKELGFLAVVISNQQGVGRGKMSAQFVNELHQKMQQDLVEYGTSIDGFYFCGHLRSDGCTCRKPQPGMLFRAAEQHGINLEKSFMIGDTITDMEAARKAGCTEIFIESDTINNELEKILEILKKS
ncbi:MAG: HAD-IIIA family hydrolase [Patescibacteria group bacterium]